MALLERKTEDLFYAIEIADKIRKKHPNAGRYLMIAAKDYITEHLSGQIPKNSAEMYKLYGDQAQNGLVRLVKNPSKPDIPRIACTLSAWKDLLSYEIARRKTSGITPELKAIVNSLESMNLVHDGQTTEYLSLTKAMKVLSKEFSAAGRLQKIFREDPEAIKMQKAQGNAAGAVYPRDFFVHLLYKHGLHARKDGFDAGLACYIDTGCLNKVPFGYVKISQLLPEKDIHMHRLKYFKNAILAHLGLNSMEDTKKIVIMQHEGNLPKDVLFVYNEARNNTTIAGTKDDMRGILINYLTNHQQPASEKRYIREAIDLLSDETEERYAYESLEDKIDEQRPPVIDLNAFEAILNLTGKIDTVVSELENTTLRYILPGESEIRQNIGTDEEEN